MRFSLLWFKALNNLTKGRLDQVSKVRVPSARDLRAPGEAPTMHLSYLIGYKLKGEKQILLVL